MSTSKVNLLIVESQAKATTIAKFLGDGYVILASGGHIKQVNPKVDSVRIHEGKVEVDWIYTPAGERLLKKVADLKLGKVLIATDPDREGEKIAHDIQFELGHNGDVDFKRVTFNSITREKVLEAIGTPGEINANLVESAIARSCLDYHLGYSLSPVLWRKIPMAKSIGRVQASALEILVTHEQEMIRNPVAFQWQATVSLNGFTFYLKEESFSKLRSEVREVLQSQFKVVRSRKTRPAPDSFNTSEIQIFANRRWGVSANSLMTTLQKMYTGEGEGSGLITYIRTDSHRIDANFLSSWLPEAMATLGVSRVDEARVQSAGGKDSGSVYDAHECIRPTGTTFYKQPDTWAEKLYNVIFRRTLATVMEPSTYVSEKLELLKPDGSTLTSKIRYTLEKGGWESVFPELSWSTRRYGFKVKLKYQRINKFTKYSEGRLVDLLKRNGIGKPSTWQTIVPTLRQRGYLQVVGNKLAVTNLGILTACYVKHYLNNVSRLDYTASMERSLDAIIRGQESKEKFLYHLSLEVAKLIAVALEGHLSETLEVLNFDKECCEKRCSRVTYFRNKNFYSISQYCETQGLSKPVRWTWISNSVGQDRVLKVYSEGDKFITVSDPNNQNLGHYLSKGSIYPDRKKKVQS